MADLAAPAADGLGDDAHAVVALRRDAAAAGNVDRPAVAVVRRPRVEAQLDVDTRGVLGRGGLEGGIARTDESAAAADGLSDDAGRIVPAGHDPAAVGDIHAAAAAGDDGRAVDRGAEGQGARGVDGALRPDAAATADGLSDDRMAAIAGRLNRAAVGNRGGLSAVARPAVPADGHVHGERARLSRARRRHRGVAGGRRRPTAAAAVRNRLGQDAVRPHAVGVESIRIGRTGGVGDRNVAGLPADAAGAADGHVGGVAIARRAEGGLDLPLLADRGRPHRSCRPPRPRRRWTGR